MPNPFAHIELTTADLKAAQKFYTKVFGWKLKDVPGMNYTMIDVGGGGTGGGMQSKPMPEAPTGWMPYVQVDDVKATMAKATKAGATAMLPYQEIGEMGAIGVFADPSGSVIGIWEAKEAPPAAPAAKKNVCEESARARREESAREEGTRSCEESARQESTREEGRRACEESARQKEGLSYSREIGSLFAMIEPCASFTRGVPNPAKAAARSRRPDRRQRGPRCRRPVAPCCLSLAPERTRPFQPTRSGCRRRG